MDADQIDSLLTSMTRSGASSLHLIPGHRPCIRIQRQFVQSEQEVLTASDIDTVTRDLLLQDHRERLCRDGQVEVLYVARSGQRFRTTVMQQEAGVSLLLRPVPEAPPRLADIQMPPQITTLTQFRSGIVLVTGFFGSGKSTTLAALVDHFNQETCKSLVTIEDPIEYLHPQAQALLHQREVGAHVGDFQSGIHQAMQSGAEVVAVSELRDGATLLAALDAAESGCLVLAGFDASSVVGALTELQALVSPEERERTRHRLANALRAITSQTLLPLAHRTGRVPMVEVMINNNAVRKAIDEAAFLEIPAIMERCRGLGMQTADLALSDLLAHHLITPEEALQHATGSLQLPTAASMVGMRANRR
ncbi:twitching motility protein PilT [Planctomycetota bacterium]|nr:twitching motility protein PilT [Planctomycetota bacterium]